MVLNQQYSFLLNLFYMGISFHFSGCNEYLPETLIDLIFNTSKYLWDKNMKNV